MNHDEHDPRSATEAERHHAARDGLYRPDTERDACGVAFVATLERTPSHAVIEQALTVLENLEHRGGVASDPQTGDGAGVLVQIPHALLEDECKRLGIPLPAAGTYGLGMLFLPRDPRTQQAAKHLIERIVDEEGQFVLGWRAVPTNPDVAGASARATMPAIAQVLIGPARSPPTTTRSSASSTSSESASRPRRAALDSRRRVPLHRLALDAHRRLQGAAHARAAAAVLPGPRDPRAKTLALALVHQRFSTNTFPSWSRAHPYRRIAHNGEINTLRGNVNWMAAREPALRAPVSARTSAKLSPVIDERQRLVHVRRRPRAARAHRAQPAARGDDDDPRGVGKPRHHDAPSDGRSTSTTRA
jgi:glutamate synthase (NADPH/NADH) large chain